MRFALKYSKFLGEVGALLPSYCLVAAGSSVLAGRYLQPLPRFPEPGGICIPVEGWIWGLAYFGVMRTEYSD